MSVMAAGAAVAGAASITPVASAPLILDFFGFIIFVLALKPARFLTEDIDQSCRG